MNLIPFSRKHKDEFLSRSEGNFNILIDKINLFYTCTRSDIGDGSSPRRKIDFRFDYEEELNDVKINCKGITTEEVASEFNDILQGCIRHQDPLTAFNLIPAPMLDVVAGMTLMSLYNPNCCWDFISGKLCLYEKKIARMLGQLVDWPRADGLVITGGKQALAYAIKNGMGRASLNCPAEMSDYVVICSALAHYSIEHVCHYLGISPENCIRVAADPSGEMNLQAFEETLDRVISEDKVIAAVIAVGGGTINFFPDSIKPMKQIIDHTATRHCLSYIPYLHVDTVISWAWLAFEKVESEWEQSSSPEATKKIKNVLSKLSGIHHADSFAADFHKIGFCPYAAGMFITKESSNLCGMTVDGSSPKENIRFGEAEMYKQTLENSRPGLAIASIWIALRRMGLEGLGQFIQYQLEVCEMFKLRIRESYGDHFEILNDHSNGWEIVLKPHFGSVTLWRELQTGSADEQQLYSRTCHQFLNDLWYGDLENEQQRTPVIGFVKSYSRIGSHEKGFPAFLIHPTSLHYNNQEIDKMLEEILRAKITFDSKQTSPESELAEEYFSQFTPPK